MPKPKSERQSQRFTLNFKDITRQDRMEGKEYTVVPMVMLNEGVHKGDSGALFYPSEEIAKTPQVWNHKPVIVYHPAKGMSACDPTILTNHKIGVIMNTVFEDNKLKAEAWLDMNRVAIVDERVADAIKNNKMLEVSTGLFTENELTEGEWNGEHYDAIVRNCRPDHLAVLPDMIGACSIEDGGGFLRLNSNNNISVNKELNKDEQKFVKNNMGSVCNHISTLLQNLYETGHGRIRDSLGSLLRDVIDDAWIEEVYDTFFIYENNGKLYKQDYDIKEEGIEFVGAAEEVIRVIEYRTKSGIFVANNRKDYGMDKKKIMEELISNVATNWGKEDLKTLEAMDEKVLEKMLPVKNEKEEGNEIDEGKTDDGTTEGNETNDGESKDGETNDEKEETVENHISKLPKEMQGVLNSGLASYRTEKKQLIGIITANERNVFTEKQLDAKDNQELRALAQLAAGEKGKVENNPLSMNYGGQADAVGNANATKEEPLPLPTLNFQEEKKQKTA